MKNVLVVGAGHLGSYLHTRWALPDKLQWRHDIALLDAAFLRQVEACVVVNCAGKTQLDWCEKHPHECFGSNVIAPLFLYRTVKEAWGDQGLFVHLSSGCLWNGPYRADGKPFEPTDPVSPACYYAWTKAACDALLLAEATTPIAVLRPRQLYSPVLSPRNTLYKLNQYEALLDTPNSMTSAATVARTIERIVVDPKLCAKQLVWNVYDLGVTSPYQVGCLLAEARCRENPCRLDRQEMDSWLIPRRVDTVLYDPVFEEVVEPPRVKQELGRVIAEFANNLRSKEL